MKKLGDKRKPKVEARNYHAYVCTPAYDGKVDTDFAVSLAEAAFCSPLFQVKMTAGVMANGAFIDLARNRFVKMFLEEETDATHLFFIDSDLKFPPNAFIGLIRAGLPICAGVYRRRQDEEDYPVKYAEHPEMGGLWIEEINDLPWLMCSRVPTGFLCIERSVVEEMAAEAKQIKVQGIDGTIPQLFYTDTLEDGRFIGEDFAFCDDYVKKYNEPIPVFTNIDFVHGGYPCNLEDFLQKKIAEEDAGDTSAA